MMATVLVAGATGRALPSFLGIAVDRFCSRYSVRQGRALSYVLAQCGRKTLLVPTAEFGRVSDIVWARTAPPAGII
jgi:hypothetical protein